MKKLLSSSKPTAVFNIALEEHKYYFPGDVIRGHVLIVPTKPLKVKLIHVQLYGRTRTYITSKKQDSQFFYKDSIKLDVSPNVLPPGASYTFTFEFTIRADQPLPSCTETMSNMGGIIDYYIEASLDKSIAQAVRIPFLERIDTTKGDLMEPIWENTVWRPAAVHGDGGIDVDEYNALEQAMISASLPQKAFARNQEMPLTIEIHHFSPNFHRDNALAISLVRYVKVLCKDKYFQLDPETVTSHKLPIDLKGEKSKTIKHSLLVPNQLSPTVGWHSRLVHVEYWLEIRANLDERRTMDPMMTPTCTATGGSLPSVLSNMRINLPVTIGTMPVLVSPPDSLDPKFVKGVQCVSLPGTPASFPANTPSQPFAPPTGKPSVFGYLNHLGASFRGAGTKDPSQPQPYPAQQQPLQQGVGWQPPPPPIQPPPLPKMQPYTTPMSSTISSSSAGQPANGTPAPVVPAHGTVPQAAYSNQPVATSNPMVVTTDYSQTYPPVTLAPPAPVLSTALQSPVVTSSPLPQQQQPQPMATHYEEKHYMEQEPQTPSVLRQPSQLQAQHSPASPYPSHAPPVPPPKSPMISEQPSYTQQPTVYQQAVSQPEPVVNQQQHQPNVQPQHQHTQLPTPPQPAPTPQLQPAPQQPQVVPQQPVATAPSPSSARMASIYRPVLATHDVPPPLPQQAQRQVTVHESPSEASSAALASSLVPTPTGRMIHASTNGHSADHPTPADASPRQQPSHVPVPVSSQPTPSYQMNPSNEPLATPIQPLPSVSSMSTASLSSATTLAMMAHTNTNLTLQPAHAPLSNDPPMARVVRTNTITLTSVAPGQHDSPAATMTDHRQDQPQQPVQAQQVQDPLTPHPEPSTTGTAAKSSTVEGNTPLFRLSRTGASPDDKMDDPAPMNNNIVDKPHEMPDSEEDDSDDDSDNDDPLSLLVAQGRKTGNSYYI
ncbi:hypothetical protein DM01DRAFT_1381562 [Hesseltinella vesiculosa]|uniref:Arrestin C-terminal-like domain-containing protein n=1 Tax=Hesseltinella vesiculosa TaxID=101127 RepID=A0A1X2GQ32_9FUNG|nr:hypothetical protein DM01DRAFT_1381562 [Hesseltinella vesiculosa]